MNGYPYQRLSDPRRAPAPSPQAVGQMLVQRGMAQGSPMTQAMGGEGPGPDDSMGHEQGESPGYEAQEGDEMQEGGPPMAGQMPGQPMMPPMNPRIPAKGMEGDYDPTTEHSPSSTKVALDQAVRAAMGRMKGSEQGMAPSATRETLSRLGMPPLEIDLGMKTGQFGDTGV